MKPNYALYCDPKGVIRVIDLTGIEEPNEPTPLQRLDSYICSVYSEELAEYHRRLEKAKYESTEVKDQGLGWEILAKQHGIVKPYKGGKKTEFKINNDTIYHISSLKVEFEDQEVPKNTVNYSEGSLFLAIISVEESNTEEESQEDLLKDLRKMYKEDGNWFSEAAISILSKNFTIKRKQ